MVLSSWQEANAIHLLKEMILVGDVFDHAQDYALRILTVKS